jgi:hypothetical protein
LRSKSARCIRSARKYGEAAVSLAALAHNSAMVLGECAFDERIMPGQGSTHFPQVLLPKLCASLNVRE